MKIQFTPPPRKLLLLLITLVIKMQFANAQLTATLTTNNISCFGMQDGSITATATGGTPPYTYEWSNQETGPNITGLAAGYYRLTVKDDFGATGYAEVTLVEPEALQLEPDINVYSNGYNISCYNCFNGSITLNINGGTTPYTHLWNDGNTNKNRFGLAPGNHNVTVTDANGCEVNSESMFLNQPERSDWTMTGNSGSNPVNNFMGTTDNVDLKFRTNNLERLSLNANGDIRMNGFVGGAGPLYVDDYGVIKSGFVPATFAPCAGTISPVWQSLSPNIIFTCLPNKLGLGTWSPSERLHVIGNAIFSATASGYTSCAYIKANNLASTNTTPDYTWFGDLNTGIFHPSLTNNIIAFTNGGTESMRIVKDANGNVIVGIGLDPLNPAPASNATPYKLMVEGKIGARDIVVRNAALSWPDYVFKTDYELKSLSEIEKFININHHLPDVPNAANIANKGQEIGTLQILQQQKIEDIYLYLIALEKRVKELEKENALLKK